MWVMNLGKPVVVPSLNEAMAIELGANLLGEGIIFIIAAGVLYSEYARQVRKEHAKEEARQEEIDNLQFTIQELYFQAEEQETKLRELMRSIHELQSRVVSIPWKRGPDLPKQEDTPPPRPPPFGPSGQRSPQAIAHPDVSPEDVILEPQTPEEEGGIIMKALAYLQINNLIGKTQDYSSTLRLT